MIALVRHEGILARYDSCDLERGRDHQDRSTPMPPTPGWISCSKILAGSAWTPPATWQPTSRPSALGSIATASRVRLTHDIFRLSTETELYAAVHVKANKLTFGTGPKTHPSPRAGASPVERAQLASKQHSLRSILSKCNNK
jgi:hypothetical protein